MRKNSLAAALALAAALLVHGTAHAAAQTKPQQKCINGINKGMAKLGDITNKALAKCVKTRAKDGTTDVSTCAFANPKIQATQDKLCLVDDKICADTPEFGPVNCFDAGRADFFADVFEDDLFDGNSGVILCGTDKPGCKCQGKVYKAGIKLYKARLKGFNKCKKLGLKNKTAPFDDITDISACVTSDAKSKIAKAETKLGAAIGAKCAAVPTPFPAGTCMGINGNALRDCIAERARCRTCLTEQDTDSLPVDCDIIDDGQDDGSCFDPS